MVDRKTMLMQAKRVFEVEIDALRKIEENLGEQFSLVIDTICACERNVVFTGMGKSGHIAKKIAATFSSLGTPAFYLHPAEARHGDLGMVTAQDIVIAISNSGETEEIIAILPNIKRIGAKIIGFSSKAESTLLKNSDIAYGIPEVEEACYLHLAPTSSTTGMLVLGDALAVCLSIKKGFTKDNFGLFHPSGALGKQLLTRVEDVMITGENNAVVSVDASLKEAILELASKGLGIVNVVDDENRLVGVFTDGNLRRLFAAIDSEDVTKKKISQFMTTEPIIIKKGKLAVDGLNLMRGQKSVSSVPVVEDDKLVGILLMKHVV